MAREIKAVVELTENQMREFLANLQNPVNRKISKEANERARAMKFHVVL